MGKRNPANKGKGKVITAAFGAVQHNGSTLQAVMVASSKKGKGAMATALWAVLPGQGKAPAFVLVVTIVGAGTTSNAMALPAAQASYNSHPRRCSAAGPLSPGAQFGLVPAPAPAPKAPKAAAPAPSSGASA